MSYLYIKQFIDEQIRILNQPLVINDDLRAIMAKNNISEEAMKSIVFKANIRLKRYLRSKFNRQVVHQIVQQIAKNEKEKLFNVNEALAKIDLMLQPVLLPDFSKVGSVNDRVRIVNELVDKLPDPDYLFAVHDLADEVNVEEKEINRDGEPEKDLYEEVETDMLVQDDQDKLEAQLLKYLEQKYKLAVNKELKEQVALKEKDNKHLKEQYTELRKQLLEMNGDLLYKQQKLEYLNQLNMKLDRLQGNNTGKTADSEDEDSEVEPSNADLSVQMSRFKILVEKLQFAMK